MRKQIYLFIVDILEILEENVSFSMRRIRVWFYDKYLTKIVFLNPQLETNCNKIKRL